MKKKKTGKSALETSFGYLASRARTVRETENYLGSMEYEEYEVNAAVERLKELNYLNDEKFAADFISSRLASKPVSRRKLREQMASHFLTADIIDEALLQVTDEMELDNARQMAEKYFRQFEGLPEEDRRQRVVRRLLSRGYGFEFIRDAVEGITGQADSINTDDFDIGEE